MNKIILSLTFLLAMTAASAQCGGNKAHHSSYTSQQHHPSDVVDVASNDARFSTLVAAVKAANLVATLRSDGPFTVFAPVNSAFDKLPEGTVASLLKPSQQKALSAVLTYHVIAGEFNAKDIVAAIKASGGSFTLATVNGDELVASLSGDSVILTDAKGGRAAVLITDVDASNGVIHVIDSVVLPS